MPSYVKLFQSILDSTIWKQPAAITKIWVTMMAMADRDGIVTAAIPGLADRAQASVETTEKALRLFMAPDRYSKTPDNEGRRIEVVKGGWRLLTYEMHREMMSKDDVKEKAAERQRRFRDRHRRPKFEQIVARDGERCGICAEEIGAEPAELDHVMSRNLGGGDEVENLQLAHAFCNASKGDGTGKVAWRHHLMPPLRALPNALPNAGNDNRSDSSLSVPSSVPSGSLPEKSNRDAKLWNEGDWLKAFGDAWLVKYSQLAYGCAGDSRGCSVLKELLGRLPASERRAAQAKAPEMFAEFFSRTDRNCVTARHPFVFFVQEWGGLRVPKLAVATAPRDVKVGHHAAEVKPRPEGVVDL